MPGITAQVVILTVSNASHSAAWYRDLMSMEEAGRYIQPDGHVAQVHLVQPGGRVELCLVSHRVKQAAFDEFRIGLDHLEFLVARRYDLDWWVARLDERGIIHSGVKEPPYTANAMVTFRDPDNIQLEFFWRAPKL
jgi:catechol 2,3-dioxygenase-like lactoylglutathione lyase family enzyme